MISFSERVIELAWVQSWQVALAAAVAAAFSVTLGRRQPHFAYLLWMIVLAKAVTPPLWSSPISVFGWHSNEGQSAPHHAMREPAPDGQAPMALTRDAASLPTDVSTDSSQPDPVALPWSILLVIVWSGGSLATVALLTRTHLALRRRLLRPSTEPDAERAGRLAVMAERVGLRATPRLRVTRLPFGPAVVGLWRPIIVLPESTLQDDQPDRLEAVLAHELVHLRRRDPLHALLQLAAVSMWWWNPVIWLASRFASWERERCCDEEVLGTLGYAGRFYAQCLLDALRARRRRLVAAVSATLTALPVTRRRLKSIVRRGQRFRARPPRWLWPVAVVLGLTVLPAGGSAQRPAPQRQASSAEPAATDPSPGSIKEARTPADRTAPVQAPQLLYLAWQKDGIRSTGKPIPHTVWDLDGKVLSDERADELLEKAGSFDVAWRREGELHPLVLVFKVDQQLTRCAVQPTVVAADGSKHSGGTARYRPTHGMNVSAAVPHKSTLGKWPQRISLEIEYPIENLTTIKIINEVPDDPVKIAPGLQWYLDPSRAMEVDPETRKLRRVTGKTAAVLQISRNVADQRIHYHARIHLRGVDRPLTESAFASFEGPDSDLQEIRVSDPFRDKDQIERVEFIRQRHDVRRIEDVPLRLDLLPASDNASRR